MEYQRDTFFWKQCFEFEENFNETNKQYKCKLIGKKSSNLICNVYDKADGDCEHERNIRCK